MTDIWGNPDVTDLRGYADERDYRFDPCYSCEPRDILPFPYFGQENLPSAIFLLYVLFAILYVPGLVSSLPRTGWHDALVGAAAFPSLLAAACWPKVQRLPYVGSLLYCLPALALALSPFALDFYLMFGR